MQVMKAVIALLGVPAVLAAPEVTVGTSDALPLSSTSTVVTFTFSETVDGFSADDVVVAGTSRSDGSSRGAVIVGAAEPYLNADGFANHRRWTVPINNMVHNSEYHISVAGGAAQSCDFDGSSCTVTADAVDSEASNDLSFDVYTRARTELLTFNPRIIVTGSTDVPFMAQFDHDVFPHKGLGADGLRAETQFGAELARRDITFGKTQWTFSVAAANAETFRVGMLEGAGIDIAGHLTEQSIIHQHSLAIQQNCYARNSWSDWTPCDPVDGTQFRTNTPVIVQGPFFGGRPCVPGAFFTESRDCAPSTGTRSCRSEIDAESQFARCNNAPSVWDECDCTPGCLTKENGLGCCPDANTVCGLGCADSGCNVQIPDFEGNALCACDWQCVKWGDCCADFHTTCAGELCGFNLLDHSPTQADADQPPAFFNDDEVDTIRAAMCSDAFTEDADNFGYDAWTSDPLDGFFNVGCHCDHTCTEWNDCCADYYDLCRGTSCESLYHPDPTVPEIEPWGRCGKTYQDCGCDMLCPYYGDCCHDYATHCAFVSDMEPVHTFLDFGPTIDIDAVVEVAIAEGNLDGNNPHAPPESCDCVANKLGSVFDAETGDMLDEVPQCCGSQVGWYGRRCGCASDCKAYNDCCPDYDDVCL